MNNSQVKAIMAEQKTGENNKIRITLNIQGMQIPMNISRENEVQFREAAKIVNDRIGDFATRYPEMVDKNPLYLYAMVLIERTVIAIDLKERNDTAPFLDVLGGLASEIEEVLKEKPIEEK